MFQLKLNTNILCVALLLVQVLGDELVVPCERLEDCGASEGAYCQKPPGECTCPAGKVFSSDLTRCLLVSENYGADCEDNAQCVARLQVGGVCDPAGTCTCREGYHYLHGQCWLSVGLNAPCSKSEQCFENHNHESLSCEAGKCVCSAGFYLRGSTHCRREGKAPGEECTFDMDCHLGDQNGVCVANKCAVGPADTSSEPQLIQEQDESATPYSAGAQRRDAVSCKDVADCSVLGPHGVCNTAGTCWCARGYFISDDTCVPELGERCAQDKDCSEHIEFSICRQMESGNGYCSCSVQYTPSKDNRECLKLRKFQFNCQSPEVCLNFGPLAQCDIEDEDPQCGCDENSHFEKDQQMCWTSRGFNESCLDDRDCATASGVDGVYCHDSKTCQCRDGYHEASLDCRRDGTDIGMACIEDDDCLFENHRCNAGVCACQVGFYEQTGTDGELRCVGGIGSPCTVSEDCLIDNSVCEEVLNEGPQTDHMPYDVTECTCNNTNAHLVSSADWSSCLKVADKYGDACVESVQCQTTFGNKSDCLNGICVCFEQYHFRDNYCEPIVELGEKCERTSECYLKGGSDKSECRNGICECLYDYEQSTTGNECTSGVDVLTSGIVLLLGTMWISSTVI